MLSFGRIDLYQNQNWLLLVPFSSTTRMVEHSILISRKPPEIFGTKIQTDPVEQYNSMMKQDKFKEFFTRMQRISKNLSFIFPSPVNPTDFNKNFESDAESPQNILEDQKISEEIVKKLFVVRKLKIDEEELHKLTLSMESKNTIFGLLGNSQFQDSFMHSKTFFFASGAVFLQSGPYLIVISEKERMGEFNFSPFAEKSSISSFLFNIFSSKLKKQTPESGKSSVQKIVNVEFVPVFGSFSKFYSEKVLTVDQREKRLLFFDSFV